MYYFRERHNLSNINIETKTADCSVCGNVLIRKTPAMKRGTCRESVNKTRTTKFTPIDDSLKPAILREAVHRTRASKKGQLPKDADINLMKNIYIFCLKGYEVDHIVAIAKGGLHHQDNLQYLPISENRKKYSGNIYNKDLSISWQSTVK